MGHLILLKSVKDYQKTFEKFGADMNAPGADKYALAHAEILKLEEDVQKGVINNEDFSTCKYVIISLVEGESLEDIGNIEENFHIEKIYSPRRVEIALRAYPELRKAVYDGWVSPEDARAMQERGRRQPYSDFMRQKKIKLLELDMKWKRASWEEADMEAAFFHPTETPVSQAEIQKKVDERVLSMMKELEEKITERRTGEIMPKGENEDWSDFSKRLEVQKSACAAIMPKGENEDWSDFYKRLEAAKNSDLIISPKGENEDLSDFYKRLEAAKKR